MPCKQAVDMYVKHAKKNKAGAVVNMTQICHLLCNQKLLWSKNICERLGKYELVQLGSETYQRNVIK